VAIDKVFLKQFVKLSLGHRRKHENSLAEGVQDELVRGVLGVGVVSHGSKLYM
jgi:hypothetical protein